MRGKEAGQRSVGLAGTWVPGLGAKRGGRTEKLASERRARSRRKRRRMRSGRRKLSARSQLANLGEATTPKFLGTLKRWTGAVRRCHPRAMKNKRRKGKKQIRRGQIGSGREPNRTAHVRIGVQSQGTNQLEPGLTREDRHLMKPRRFGLQGTGIRVGLIRAVCEDDPRADDPFVNTQPGQLLCEVERGRDVSPEVQSPNPPLPYDSTSRISPTEVPGE